MLSKLLNRVTRYFALFRTIATSAEVHGLWLGWAPLIISTATANTINTNTTTVTTVLCLQPH